MSISKCRIRGYTSAWLEWIEITAYGDKGIVDTSLTPHGVSGLKSVTPSERQIPVWSHPTRGEWIEILRRYSLPVSVMVSPHTG